ncbi:MAG: flagellar basal-body rod protein FlgF [Azospirillum brasilense]|nr:MAG: flagellar basal-body rod protein FlgF [Azospirillum brasilense]
MDNSIYITLSRQMALFRDMEVTANNIANVDTPGYQGEKLLFSDFLVKDVQNTDRRNTAYALDPMTYRDTSSGRMKTTGNTFDVAISGDAYFQVQSPLGVRYTRSGNFQVDAEGNLVTVEGYPVLGNDGGTITLPQNAVNVDINGSGQITVDGQDAGQIGMVEFANPQGMTRLGNNFYTAAETPIPSETARMAQGVLESSNVTAVTEMVRVMNVSRSVGNTAKFIETMYDLERRTGQIYARQQA